MVFLLFQVLGGVRTGCFASSILFLMCINLFLNVFAKLSDILGFSLARVFADDFGSVPRMRSTLKTHASTFKLAAYLAGLHLKAAKCVLVITCTKLDGDAHFATSNWLRINVPDVAKFFICSSGKYLG